MYLLPIQPINYISMALLLLVLAVLPIRGQEAIVPIHKLTRKIVGSRAEAATAQRLQTLPISLRNTSVARAGQSMVLTMDVVLDSVRMSHGRQYVLQPILTSANGEHTAVFQPLIINSHDQHIMYLRNGSSQYPDAQEVCRKGFKPMTHHYLAQVEWQDWMRAYRLNMGEDFCGCGTLQQEGSEPLLASGNLEPTAAPRIAISLTPDDHKKVRSIQGQAFIDFPVNRTELHPDYRRNPQELQKIVETIDQVRGKDDVEIMLVTIHGYASPEGSYQNNVRLAEGRAATLRQYIQNLYSFNPDIIASSATPEDWDGLRRYVATHNMPEQKAILQLIDSDMEPDTKNDQIRQRFPERYQQLLSEVYPALRHSDYKVFYHIRPYTLDEARRIYQMRPADLSVSELYELASDAGLDTDRGRDILYTAARLNPDNPRAVLLAAQAAFQSGDLQRAEQLLDSKADSPQAAYLMGAIRKMQQRYDEALQFMLTAEEGGIDEAARQIKEINELK